MNEKNDKKEDGKRYLKKFQIVETDTELPIQGQISDPEDMQKFLDDLQDEQVPKVICVYLDKNNGFLGHQVCLGSSAENFNLKFLWHYFLIFLAEKFIVLTNHASGDATPDDADLKLIQKISVASQAVGFDPYFADYIIVGKGTYFSRMLHDGTGCHCGHQEELH